MWLTEKKNIFTILFYNGKNLKVNEKMACVKSGTIGTSEVGNEK